MPGQPQLRVPRLDFQLEGLSHGEKSCRVRKTQRALLTTSPSAPHTGCTRTQTLTHTHALARVHSLMHTSFWTMTTDIGLFFKWTRSHSGFVCCFLMVTCLSLWL